MNVQSLWCRECDEEWLLPYEIEWDLPLDAALGPCCSTGILRQWQNVVYDIAHSEFLRSQL